MRPSRLPRPALRAGRLPALLLGLALPFLAPAAMAQDMRFRPPGLESDAGAYARELLRRGPAAASPQLRAQAETRAREAEARGDWAAAVAAWEQRLGMPQATPEQWLALGRAQLSRTPPEPQRALQAAWRSFTLSAAGEPEVPALVLMALAFRQLDQWVQTVAALEAAQQRAPLDQNVRAALTNARREAGLLLRNIRTEPEAEPARACLSFYGTLNRGNEYQPGDYLRADPPIPNLTVTREDGQICIAGLPWGTTSRLTLRAGLPGEDGVRLRQDTPLAIAMPDRRPRLVFDGTRFILPRGQAARVGLASMNVRALKLRLVRVTERNLRPFADWAPRGDALSDYMAEQVPERWGRTVWEGRAEVPNFRANALNRTVLPLPEEINKAGPGLYVLLAAEDTGPGQQNGERLIAGLPILSTDLGLTAWRGEEGLAAQLRGLQEAAPRAGVRVALLSRANDILAEAETDADGLVRFPAPLLRGTGPMAPVALHAEAGDDLVALDLDAAAFDLSDRGAEGLPQPGPLDLFLWLDRGIYRPGETVQLSGLLRDAAGAPRDLPIRLQLMRPNGQVAAETVATRGPDGSLSWPVPLSAGAAAGLWSINARLEPDQPPLAVQSFRVEAFVPERLAVQFGPAPGPLLLNQPLAIPYEVRFLYGAPGAGLEGEVEGQLSVDTAPFAPDAADGTQRRSPWEGWRFGLSEEAFSGGAIPGGSVTADADGRGSFEARLAELPDTSRPLRARFSLSVADPNGRATSSQVEVPVRGANPYIAIRPGFQYGSVEANSEAGFDVALVSPEGQALSGRLQARLVRERPQWRIVTRGGMARYETVWQDEPVDSATLTTAPDKPGRFARTLPFGRYRLEVTQPGGLAIAAVRFRSGWVGSDSPEVPDKVDVSADRAAYPDGATARLHIQSPFAGQASLAVLTNRLISLRNIPVREGANEVELPVDAAWGPGAYAAVTVFRPGAAADGQPRRALGLAWVALDPAPRRLGVAIEAPEKLRPRQRAEIPLRITGAEGMAHLTLAAVDEGVLRLTQFQSPDPAAHFLGRRRLGTDLRDDYGRLIPPPEGELAALRQGGDGDAAASGITPPQRVVALFSGVVAVGADGVARVPLDLPEFNGEIRLMAVAWAGRRVGSASRPLLVRDPVVAEALLPRFLAPGDAARMPLLLHNLELPRGEVTAEITVEGPLALEGNARLSATLGTGERADPAATLRSTGAGEGVVRLAVTGPEGYRATQESRITIRSSRPRVTEVTITELAPRAEARLAPDLSRYVPGTAVARASWGQPVRYDAEALMRAALEFPLWCTEQSATKALALAAWPAAEEREVKLAAAVAALLDKQRWDGGFGLWSAQGELDPWVTAYATEALLRARAAGATVADGALTAALNHLQQAAEESPSSPEEYADQAYRLHVLALAGRGRPGATRRLAQMTDRLPTPLSMAQLGAALARMGDVQRAEAAFDAALESGVRRRWAHDFGTPLRDLLAVALLMRESGLRAEQMAPLLAKLPAGPELSPGSTSTQEQAWAVLLAASLGRDGRPARIAIDGQERQGNPVLGLAVPEAGLTARNVADRPVVQSISVTGLPAQPLPAARLGMRVSRRFLTMEGTDVNLDTLRQGDRFILLLEARAETGETHRALLQQGLPAGWEVETQLPSGAVSGMPFLGSLTAPDSVAALDDRVAVAMTLTAGAPLARVAVVLRAVTAGSFELPGAQLEDMYRPGVFARQNSGRLTIAPR